MAKRSKRDALAHLAEDFQARGHYFFTKREAQKELGISDNAFRRASWRLIRQTKLLRVRNNFYVIIPTEYRHSHGPPPSFYIDALMKFCKQPYYVGVLSAAALHGAAHQSPQELQVVTNKPMKTLEPGGARIRFITKKNLVVTPIEQMKTPTGFIAVSSPEATAFDLVKYARLAGNLDNVTTVLLELAEKIDPKKIVQIAKSDPDLATAQRLGYLLDRFCKPRKTNELEKWLKRREPKFIYLRPDKRTGVMTQNQRWHVAVNVELEPDL